MVDYKPQLRWSPSYRHNYMPNHSNSIRLCRPAHALIDIDEETHALIDIDEETHALIDIDEETHALMRKPLP